MKTVLYTAIYGEQYDIPKPLPDFDIPCILYTDSPYLEAPGWEVRYVPLRDLPTPMMRAKWWKTMAHVAAPDADATIWIDGSVTPHSDFVTRCQRALGDSMMALTPHPWRDCIYDELEASVGLPKYEATAMQEQCALYRARTHPAHWGLFASGIMMRRNQDLVRSLNVQWWFENRDRSWQDQLSLPYVLRRQPKDFKWKASLPWAEWWGISNHGT